MPFLELFDETLDINSTENYDLTIQLSRDEVSLCILDTIRNKFILLRAFTPDSSKNFSHDQLEELITKDDFLGKKYRKIYLVLPSAKSTLVPAALYDPAKKDEYFSFNFTISESNSILTNKLNDPDSYLLFSVSKPVSDLIRVHYPQSLPVHHLKPLLHQIQHTEKSSSDYYIYAHVEASFFNLIIFDNHRLKLCNSFVYRNTSDIMYHILNVFKSLNIRQEESIILSGQTERYDDLYSSLSLYIRSVKFAEPTGNFTFSYVFNEAALHRYINLFTAGTCE